MDYKEYISLIKEMLDIMRENDKRFIVQVYTITKKHLEKKEGGH